MTDFFTVNELAEYFGVTLRPFTGDFGLRKSQPTRWEGLGGLQGRILCG